jgi:hypothetical protein
MRNNFSVRLIASALLLGIAIWSVFGPPKPGVTDKAFTVRAPQSNSCAETASPQQKASRCHTE